MRCQGPSRGRRRQAGAIGLLGALVMVLMVLCIALALDTGRLYMEKRNLQRIADLAALEAVGRAEDDLVTLTDAALTVLAEEAAVVPASDADLMLEAQGGGICREAFDLADSSRQGRRRLFQALARGASDRCDGSSAPLRRTAVRVLASRDTRASLLGSLLGEGRVNLEAEAVARRRPREVLATFSLGSRLLHADGSGLLGRLLGDDLRVTALGYQGLAEASLSVADLIELAAEAGSANGLLEEVRLDVADLARAGDLRALARQEGDDAEVLTLGIELFRGALEGFVALGLETVRLGDIAVVETDEGDEALQAEVGLLSLLESLVFVGNGRFLEVEDLGIDLGVLGGVDLALQVIEAPRIAIGPVGCATGTPPCGAEWRTSVRTAQVRLGARIEVGVPLVAGMDVLVGLRVAGARGGIEEAVPRGDREGEYRLTAEAYHQPVGVNLGVGLSLLSGGGALDDWIEGLEAEDWDGSPMTPSPGLIEWPAEDRLAFEDAGAGDLAGALLDEADSLEVTVTVLGHPVTIPADDLLGVLEPALTELATQVLSPLLELLGLQLSGADMHIVELQAGTGGAELVL